jgi:hypothetical protein
MLKYKTVHGTNCTERMKNEMISSSKHRQEKEPCIPSEDEAAIHKGRCANNEEIER